MSRTARARCTTRCTAAGTAAWFCSRASTTCLLCPPASWPYRLGTKPTTLPPQHNKPPNTQDPANEVLWTAHSMPADSKPKYGMTTYAMGLNAMEENVCPTDSRLRPDLRQLEEGNFALASSEKHRLEEKQRAARRERGDVRCVLDLDFSRPSILSSLSPTPPQAWGQRWFKKISDPQLGRSYHVYKGGYWDAKAEQAFQNAAEFSDIY